jgi:hypothetical protein
MWSLQIWIKLSTTERDFGIGPFRVIDWPQANDIQNSITVNRQLYSAWRLQSSSVELELISRWREVLGRFLEHGGGIHHIRFNVDEIEPVQDYLLNKGIEAAQYGSGIRPGTLWMNFDTEDKVGFVIEVMKVLPGTDGRTPKIIDGKVLA